MDTIDAESLLKQGNCKGALDKLTAQIRAKPADSKLRVFLAQLLCVMGQWERALNQLTVAAEMDPAAVPMRQMYGDAIQCEGVRAQVFAGSKTPMIFGQPEEWLAMLIESLLRAGRGEHAMAEGLRAQAFEKAPASSGTINGAPFEWIMDADARIGPVLEAYVKGRYYWVPFTRLSRVEIEKPEDLRDAVWTPAHLWFDNGGESIALIPTRYAGSEASADGLLQLSRKTEWIEKSADVYYGLGQRSFATDADDVALLDIRELVFNAAADSGAAAATDQG